MKGLNLMLKSDDRNVKNQLNAIRLGNYDELKKELERIVGDKEYHSDEISETDVERANKDRVEERRNNDSNRVIKVYKKNWRSDQVIVIMGLIISFINILF